VIRGNAFIQDLRRGHYELGVEAATHVYGPLPHSTNPTQQSVSPQLDT
jgi:hypothetical protein